MYFTLCADYMSCDRKDCERHAEKYEPTCPDQMWGELGNTVWCPKRLEIILNKKGHEEMNEEKCCEVKKETITSKLSKSGAQLTEIKDMVYRLLDIIEGDRPADNPIPDVSSVNDEVNLHGDLIIDIKRSLAILLTRFEV